MSDNEIKYPTINPVIAYFKLGVPVWVSLIIGWLIFAFSAVFNWEVPASGAVMVCVALIAEIFYEQFWWRKMPCDAHGCFPLKRDSNTSGPIIWSYQVVPAWNGKTGALLSLSRKNEIMNVQGNPDPLWRYREVVQRVEKKFLIGIVLTAVVGTLIWGYAHLVFTKA